MDYDEYFYLDKDFRELISNKDAFRKSIEKFLNNIIDDITLGIIFDVHRKYKTLGDLDLVAEQSTSATKEIISSVDDIFGNDNLKKELVCDCPICNDKVAACRFAPHLEKCMGLSKRQSSRIANNNSNNNNTKDKEDSSDISMPSDDEHDWNSRQKRRKKKSKSKPKKGKNTPKKTVQSELDAMNVDVEGDEDGEVLLRDIMHDNSNQSSPPESVSSNTSSLKLGKAWERSKSKKKRDRTSPVINLD